MLDLLINIHSLWRWVVLIAITVALIWALAGWLRGGNWGDSDRILMLVTIGAIDLQVLLGIIIWLSGQYWNRGAFFAITHPLVMILALVVAHVGSTWTKRTSNPVTKYRTLAISLFLVLFLITAAIPPDSWRRAWVS